MKKIFLLSCLAMLLFSCTKEKAPTTPDQPEHVKVIKPFTLNPGSGATIAYDAASGLYKANYGGAELVFSPIPTNSNYTDGDVASVGISCTNCNYLQVASNSYFVASIPTLPLDIKDTITRKLSTYNRRFNDYITAKYDTIKHAYVEPTLPNFPQISGTYSAIVSGLIVRSHSSPSTCMVLPSTYTPNPVPRNIPPGTPVFIGSIASLLYPGVVYDFKGASTSSVIASVNVLVSPAITVTWSGSFTTVTNSTGTDHYITVDIYHDNVLYEHFVNVKASRDPL